MLGLVNDDLDLSSMADGRISLKLEGVSVKEVLSEVVEQVPWFKRTARSVTLACSKKST